MKRFTLALAALLAVATVNAQVYEWKDEKGKTTFSDKPPVGNVRAQRISEAGSPAPGNAAQKTLADRDLEFRKRQKESHESGEKAKKDQLASAEKKENCENARRMLEAIESGERIALRDDKGERYYMDDGQREQASAKARQTVQANCQP